MNFKNPFITTLISGIFGGVALIIWNSKERADGNTQGTWLLYIFVISIGVGLLLITRFSDHITYWERVKYGTFSGLITNILFIIYETVFTSFRQHTAGDQLFLLFVTIAASFVFSLFVSLFIKKRAAR